MRKSLTIFLCMVLSLCITQEPHAESLDSENQFMTSILNSPENRTPFGIQTGPQLYQFLPKLGASWTFIGILWEDIEPEQDVWTFERADEIMKEAQTHNVNLIVKIRTGTCWATKEESGTKLKASSPPENIEDYIDFVCNLVSRYNDSVDFWAIENEMNTETFWRGTLEEYNQILETAYKTIKEIDPDAQVLDSGMASMTYGICIAREMYERGNTQEAVIFFNEYYRRRGLTISSQDLNQVLYSEEAQKVYTIMNDHFKNPYYDIYQLHFYEDYSVLNEVITFIKTHLEEEKQIFAVEMGYAYRDDYTYNVEDHAEDTVKLMVSLLAEQVPVQIYLPLIGSQKENEEWRGLLSPQRERRPALYSYRVTTTLLKERTFTQKVDNPVIWYEFDDIIVMWSDEETTVNIPLEKAVIIDIYGGKTEITSEDLPLKVGTSPIFIVKREDSYAENEGNEEIEENVEIVEFPSYDGVMVEGFAVRPQGDGRFPAVILVHGGISSREASSSMARTIGIMAAEKGYVSLSVHYRNGPLGLQDVEDTLSAIEFAKTLDYVDGERIGVYGGSHGGYIALMCAWRSNVKCVVEAAGFCDLADMVERLSTREGMDNLIKYYGGYPEEVPDVYAEYSPCGHIPEFQAAVFIVHGRMDTTVPVEHAYMLEELLQQHGKPYRIYISETEEHGFYHRKSEEAQKVWALIFEFFDTYLKY
ncbi:MAG: prolyl oligopeptidase family serine peptidase [Theionarchaea archaeon]|nr:prolyl oligopeptidase family serine peptidase [Theionarchaea archaeon]